MKILCSIVIGFLMVAAIEASGQNRSFQAVDSFAIAIGSAHSLNIPQLSRLLTDKFKDPVDKTRAIYTWIAHNVAYDCPAFHVESRRKNSAEDVFKQRKAVCDGYANLFMDMCSSADIRCLSIDGFARNGSEEIGAEPKEPNHTWNAVQINGEWKLIDVTWASGYTDEKVKVFTPKFNEHYFFTDPQLFILNHYPKLDTWKLKAKMSKDRFFDNPSILQGYFENQLTAFSPAKGIIKAKPNEALIISITLEDVAIVEQAALAIGEPKKQQLHLDYSQAGNTISFRVQQQQSGIYPITIYVNKDAALEYRLDIQ